MSEEIKTKHKTLIQMLKFVTMTVCQQRHPEDIK